MVQSGKSDRFCNSGQTVYVNINGKRVRAIAANEINSTNVVVALGDDGNYYAWSSTSPQLIDRELTYFKNNLATTSKTELIYKIYYLLQTEELTNSFNPCIYYHNWVSTSEESIGDLGLTYISEISPRCDLNTLPTLQSAIAQYHKEDGYLPSDVYQNPQNLTFSDIINEAVTLEPDLGGYLFGFYTRRYRWILAEDLNPNYEHKIEFTVTGNITKTSYRRHLPQYSSTPTISMWSVTNDFLGNRINHTGDSTNYNYQGAVFYIQRLYDIVNQLNQSQLLIWDSNNNILGGTNTIVYSLSTETISLNVSPLILTGQNPQTRYKAGSEFIFEIDRDVEVDYHLENPPSYTTNADGVLLDLVTTYSGGFTIDFKVRRIDNIIAPLPIEVVENKAKVFYLFSPIDEQNYKIKKLIEYNYSEVTQAHISVAETEEIFITIKAGYNNEPDSFEERDNFRKVDFFKFVDEDPEILEHQTFNYPQTINNIYPEDPLVNLHNYFPLRYANLAAEERYSQEIGWNYSELLAKFLTVRVGDENINEIGLYPIIAINLLSQYVNESILLSIDYETQNAPYFWQPGENYDVRDNFQAIPRLIPANSEFNYLLNSAIADPLKMRITPFILVSRNRL